MNSNPQSELDNEESLINSSMDLKESFLKEEQEDRHNYTTTSSPTSSNTEEQELVDKDEIVTKTRTDDSNNDDTHTHQPSNMKESFLHSLKLDDDISFAEEEGDDQILDDDCSLESIPQQQECLNTTSFTNSIVQNALSNMNDNEQTIMNQQQISIFQQWYFHKSHKFLITGKPAVGKTFLALYSILNLLLDDTSSSSKKILYIAPTNTLCHYAFKWIYTRLQAKLSSNLHVANILQERMYFACPSFEEVWDICSCSCGRSSLQVFQIHVKAHTHVLGCTKCQTLSQDLLECFQLVVVDEFHCILCQRHVKNKNRHMFALHVLDFMNEIAVSNGNCGILALMDCNQLENGDVTCFKEFFQNMSTLQFEFDILTLTDETHLPDSASLGTNFCKCMLRSDDLLVGSNEQIENDKGKREDSHPSIQTYLFDKPHRWDALAKIFFLSTIEQMYVWKTTEAIIDMLDSFESEVDLDSYIAIAVPDESFRTMLLSNGLQDSVVEYKFEDNCRLSGKKIRFTRALNTIGLTTLQNTVRIVVDTVENLQGLEFMGVIGVGLDRREDDADIVGKDIQIRQSLLYKAMSRSRLVFAAVNENISNGYVARFSQMGNSDEQM